MRENGWTVPSNRCGKTSATKAYLEVERLYFQSVTILSFRRDGHFSAVFKRQPVFRQQPLLPEVAHQHRSVNFI